MIRPAAAAQFEAEEQLNIDALALELAISDAGGWDEYVKIRDEES